MPTLDSYIFFDGNCAEAMRFYERTLGGKLEAMLTYADAPPSESSKFASGDKDKVMHTSLVIDGRRLMASDEPGTGYQKMQGFSLSLSYPSVDEARRVFAALSEGGKVIMPIDKTFWAEAFGMVTDRFGTPWMVGGGEEK